MRLKYLIVFLSIGFLFATESINYSLNHLYWAQDKLSRGFSGVYERYAQLGDHFTNFDTKLGNRFVNKSDLFQEYGILLLDSEIVHVVSVSMNNYVLIGNTVTFDILFSKNLNNFSGKIDGATLNNVTMIDPHAYSTYVPLINGEKDYVLDLNYADNITGLINQVVTISLFVDGGNKKISQFKIISEDKRYLEVHQDKQNAVAMAFTLKAIDFPQYIDSVYISTNIRGGVDSFKSVAVYDRNYKSRIGTRDDILPNSHIKISMTTEDILYQTEREYMLLYSLKDNMPINLTYNISIRAMDSRKLTGNHRAFYVTADLVSLEIIVVSKNKPIILDNTVKEYIGSSNFVQGKIRYELAEGSVQKARYRVYNIVSNNYSAWKEIQSPTKSAILGLFSTEYNITANYGDMKLNQNVPYNVICQLIGDSSSREITSNRFLVDTTPPTRPPKLGLTVASRKTQINEVRSFETVEKTIEFTISYDVSLDEESGICAYRVYGKTPKEPSWRIYISGDFTVTPGYAEVISITLNNELYSFNYSVGNNAGIWSDQSESIVFDLRGETPMVDTLFNWPNPFDSRIQDTTIRYTLQRIADVELTIYDMFGYKVKKWSFVAGAIGGQVNNSIVWNGTNELGVKVSKGGYILILKTTDSTGSKVEKKSYIGVIH